MKKLLFGGAGLVLVVTGLIMLKTATYPEISVVIAPHHDLVAEQRYDMLEEISSRLNGKTIVLVSPNHYNSGRYSIQTRADDFETRFGTVKVDKELLSTALQLGANEDIGGFSNEHGIYSLLPDIVRLMPDSKILPLVVKADTDKEMLDTFFASLNTACPNCVLLASIDMSHYQPYALSELHDEMTIRTLKTLDSQYATTHAEVDAPLVLREAILWADRNSAKHFKLTNHTNSTELSGEYFIEGTTHLYGWYEEGTMGTADPSVSFTFGGDVSYEGSPGLRFGADLRDSVRQLGDRVLWGTDVSMMNLEGVITDGVLDGSDPFAIQNRADVLNVATYLKVDAFNLENNHRLDFGAGLVEKTAEALASRDVAVVDRGAHFTADGHSLQVKVLSFDTTDPQEGFEDTIALQEDAYSRTVVYTHWGKEFDRAPFESQREYAKSWIDAGADLIIGTGSHVVGETEIIDGVPVFYSLGNFIFDNDFNPLGEGMILSGVFYEDGLRLLPSLITNENGLVLLQRNEDANTKIKALMPDFEPYIHDERGGIVFELN